MVSNRVIYGQLTLIARGLRCVWSIETTVSVAYCLVYCNAIVCSFSMFFCYFPSNMSLCNGQLTCNSVAAVNFESTAGGLNYVLCMQRCSTYV